MPAIMVLPFFLQPLLLVAYYQNCATQSLKSWFHRYNDQLFGPLEQAIAVLVIINLAMKRPTSPLGIIRPPQTQMLQSPLSNLTDDQDSRSNSSRTLPDGTIAIDSWNDGFSMSIISLSFFCSKLTSWMNPASIIIAFLLILNLVKSFNCHLRRKLRERSMTLWDSHNSFEREERAIGAQAHSSINEGTQIKTEAPSKKVKENEFWTRPSSFDKQTVRQSAKELAEDKVNRPRDPGRKVRERIKDPTEIDNHGRISSTNEAVNSIQKEKPERSESSSSSEQIRVLTVSEKAQESTAANDQVESQSSKISR
ncbi:hypothetical protein CNBG_4343 [Cryptococcus deuterogattii R265]|uniref:uncharacterized protein n=1 Tax=Cryptococcus deuterogattii (strain R265) TaxID=294750 RepID=UPI00193831CC|nr:hypothetical protein CNBG_4343 [Cryptococcus deuterogattii R265]